MKRFLVLASLATAMACAPERTPEVVEAELIEQKHQLAEINKAIKALEEELATYDSSVVDEGVKVGVKTLESEVFTHYFRVGGVAEAELKSYISPEMGGQIKKVHVVEGQRVKKGDLLITLNASALYSQIAGLKTQLELVTTIYNKQKELWDQKIGSEIQFLEAKTNKEALEQNLKTVQAQLDMTTINAPFDGIVDEIIGKEGELSSPGFELVRMVNLNRMEITSEIAETYLGKIKKGDKVSVELPSLNNQSVEAKIDRIGNIINPNNRSFKVIVKLKNGNEAIKPNMVAVVEMQDYENPSTVVVPSVIVKSDVTGKSFLFVAENNGEKVVAKKVFVKPGRSYLDQTEILEGLKPGQKVIVDGYSNVSSGVPVQIVQ